MRYYRRTAASGNVLEFAPICFHIKAFFLLNEETMKETMIEAKYKSHENMLYICINLYSTKSNIIIFDLECDIYHSFLLK